MAMENEKRFYIDQYLSQRGKQNRTDNYEASDEEQFRVVCDVVKNTLDREWEMSDDATKAKKLEREKNAIIGYEKDTAIFKDRIKAILAEKNLLAENYPSYYPSLEEAVFAELYGLAGLTPWAYDMTEAYAKSSSAKLVGDRLYCLIDGKSQLQPQRIPLERRNQLKRALLLATPKERLEEGFHEVYLHNGIRITIFAGDRTKAGQDVMVFRKYVLKELTLEKMAELHTIPEGAVPLFKSMIAIGYNTVFTGPVRSGKTTFLQTWQSYEDKSLEGLAVATDPETPWHEIMGDAPIMQLIADGKQLDTISRSILRSDSDYVILEEMRDATAYNLFMKITSMGTQRSKGTIHDSSAVNIPYKMASAITTQYAGDEQSLISQCFTNINYVLEFYQVPEDKSKKRLRGITEFRYDAASDKVSAHRICQYDPRSDKWFWKCDIGQDKAYIAIGYEKEFEAMYLQLKKLAEANPLTGNTVIYPSYYEGNRKYGRREKTI